MNQRQARVRLTAGRISSFSCPPEKSQAFLWDTEAPSLALRATPTGRKTFIFESRLNGATIRITIGTPSDWPLDRARTKAQALKILVDEGKDPREEDRRERDQVEADRAAALAKDLAFGDAWWMYLKDRQAHWGERHYKDHLDKVAAGGRQSTRGTRGTGVTLPGPLHAFMHLPLRSLNAQAIEAWAAREGKTRPTSTRLAWRHLKAFLAWCAQQPAVASALAGHGLASTGRTRALLGTPSAKSDVLLREQLPAWFRRVRAISNAPIAASIQAMLLTGARPGEVLAIRWSDVDTTWNTLVIRDKVDGQRSIPLTPYVRKLMDSLPHMNEWVFASGRWLDGDAGDGGRWEPRSATGRICMPNHPHTQACREADIEGLTLHGLRRSFASLTEWLEIPAGVVAQIQGHKPSATAEKHYKRRPLDLLRVHHEKIEAWILAQAGVKLEADQMPARRTSNSQLPE